MAYDADKEVFAPRQQAIAKRMRRVVYTMLILTVAPLTVTVAWMRLVAGVPTPVPFAPIGWSLLAGGLLAGTYIWRAVPIAYRNAAKETRRGDHP